MTVHGSPKDRGSADRYYGRPFEPHWYPQGTYNGRKIEEDEMNSDQVEEYKEGWNNEINRKNWG
tara:strand:+ start:598 stop:789 length:192 start_codon:yes stop_codon:yes gene_type:complete